MIRRPTYSSEILTTQTFSAIGKSEIPPTLISKKTMGLLVLSGMGWLASTAALSLVPGTGISNAGFVTFGTSSGIVILKYIRIILLFMENVEE